jgi:hypothetical protein
MRQLGRVCFQELAPCWGAEEKLFDLHRGAASTRGHFQFARQTFQQPGIGLGRDARQQRAVGNGIDGSQRLTPKAHGRHRLQLVQRSDLAGCMALEGNGQIVPRNSTAVIFYRNQPHTARQQTHGDLRGACIQRVVYQLANHRGRALNHLASRNLADQLVREFTDRATR